LSMLENQELKSIDQTKSVILEVLDPRGASDGTNPHAKRLNSLDGKIIGLLSNDAWQAIRMLPLIRELLQERFPTAKFISHAEFPTNKENIDSEGTIEAVVSRGCQAVILGNAA